MDACSEIVQFTFPALHSLLAGAELSRWYVQSMLTKLQAGGTAAGGPRNSSSSGTPTPASLMREMLCRLGPAFIKIGQALSRCGCPNFNRSEPF